MNRITAGLILILVLWVTNMHVPLDFAIRRMEGAFDVMDYKALATKPVSELQDMNLEHRQRFVIPSLIGWLSRKTHLSLDLVFTLGTLLTLLTMLWVLMEIFREFRISQTTQLISVFLVLFNPHLFRFYIAYPGVIVDAVFLLGTALAVLGLVRGKIWIVIPGFLIAGLGRQTTFLLLPAVWLWVFGGESWKSFSRSRKIWSAMLVSFSTLALYGATAWFLGEDLIGSENRSPFLQFLNGPNQNLIFEREAKFFVWGVFPFVPGLFVLAGAFFAGRKIALPPREFYYCLVCMMLLLTQSLVWALTFVDFSLRYSLLTFVFFITALAMVLDSVGFGKNSMNRFHMVICLAIFLSSFHHQTSVVYLCGWSILTFGWLYLISGLIAFVAAFLSMPRPVRS